MLFAVLLSLFALYQSTSICDKYSKALNTTNKGLVTTVVNGVVAKVTATGAVTKKYFDGTKPKGSTNFLDASNSAALKALVDSLVQFFGGGLGCSDGTITKYTGPSMSKVHQKMGIYPEESVFFNDQVIAVLAGAGVSSADQIAVRGVLNSFNRDVISQSICDKYSVKLKLTNKQLVTSVVGQTFALITSSTSIILKYFNGEKPPGSTDFLNKNKDALPGLVNGLVTFFGGALGCHDGTIAPYAGPDIGKLHKPMGIKTDEFNFFNLQLLTVLRKSGVSMPDLRAVDMVLNSTKSAIVSVP